MHKSSFKIHIFELLMCTETSLTIKDFIPLIGTILTLLAGYYFLTVQVRKNRRVKWIDDFRNEIAIFLSLAANRRDANYRDLFLSAKRIELYLNPENEKHNELVYLLKAVLLFLENEPSPFKIYDETIAEVDEITNRAKEIIKIEQKKLLFDLQDYMD